MKTVIYVPFDLGETVFVELLTDGMDDEFLNKIIKTKRS